MSVVAPELRPAQAAAWHALFALHHRLPSGWTLVGGQMVQSLCWERGAAPNRPTVDADAVLDVRSQPHMLFAFTAALRDLGFAADGESFEGHQHRWVRGPAQIDVLIPRFLGPRADSRRGVTGGTTIAAPGAEGALRRTERVEHLVNGVLGAVLRPTLQGAITAKAAAVGIVGADPTRHLSDIATLAALVTRRDRVAVGLSTTERRRVLAALALIDGRPSVVRAAGVDGSAVERLRLALRLSDGGPAP